MIDNLIQAESLAEDAAYNARCVAQTIEHLEGYLGLVRGLLNAASDVLKRAEPLEHDGNAGVWIPQALLDGLRDTTERAI